MIVQYHPLTASDLNTAVSYYNRQRPGLGDEFRSEIDARALASDGNDLVDKMWWRINLREESIQRQKQLLHRHLLRHQSLIERVADETFQIRAVVFQTLRPGIGT